MSEPIAIVDYGIGNLFSVANACARVGAPTRITNDPRTLLRAPAVILPGVGAMPDAMAVLRATGLADALVEVAARGTPLLGICLGLQLLMREGTEFEPHAGLGLIDGDVVRLEGHDDLGRPLRVPHLGWNTVHTTAPWRTSALADTPDGSAMYFVHSFHVRPRDASVILTETHYGSTTFCSAVQSGSLTACQFHPERSGPLGLGLLRQFALRAGVGDIIQESVA